MAVIKELSGYDPHTGVVRVALMQDAYPDRTALPYWVAAYLEGGRVCRHYWFKTLKLGDKKFESMAREHFPEQFEWQEAHMASPPVSDQYSDWLMLLNRHNGEICVGQFYEWAPGEILDLIQFGRDAYKLDRKDYYWKPLPDGKAILKLINGEKP